MRKNAELVKWYYETCNEVFATKDPDLTQRWLDATADDLIYGNRPLPDMHGKAKFLEWVGALSENCEYMHIDVQRVAEDDDWVFTKRHEEWKINGVAFGGDIMGIARVQDGQIVELYDYMPHFEGWRYSGQMPLEFFAKYGDQPSVPTSTV